MCLVSFPREGDANYSTTTWGHDDIKLMNGWFFQKGKYLTVYSMGSYNGKICYCIEPSTMVKSGDRLSSTNETYWDNYPDKYNKTISGENVKLIIGRILQYGYTGTISTSWRSQNSEDAAKLSNATATQLLIWETIVGERDAEFNHVAPKNCSSVLDYIRADNPLRSEILNYCIELEPDERLRIFHDFYRTGEETDFYFDIKETRKRGHDFKDFICPDSMEIERDYFKIGERYGRVLFLKEYASYIKDSMVAELTDLNRNLMMSIDVVPVPTDEAVREAENRLLGVETNATNWQRRQNANNNFSAQLPYDIEQQRKEMKEFLDDLTTRDQRMMFAVLTMVHTADTKEQLDNDTEALLTTARRHILMIPSFAGTERSSIPLRR